MALTCMYCSLYPDDLVCAKLTKAKDRRVKKVKAKLSKAKPKTKKYKLLRKKLKEARVFDCINPEKETCKHFKPKGHFWCIERSQRIGVEVCIASQCGAIKNNACIPYCPQYEKAIVLMKDFFDKPDIDRVSIFDLCKPKPPFLKLKVRRKVVKLKNRRPNQLLKNRRQKPVTPLKNRRQKQTLKNRRQKQTLKNRRGE